MIWVNKNKAYLLTKDLIQLSIELKNFKVWIMISFMNVEEIKIKNVKKNQSSLNVEWSDGEKSSFNFLWLRDNCPTSVHPYARHRIFNL